MKYTKNYLYKRIAEKLTEKTYTKHYTIHYYLREILGAYHVTYDKHMTINRMLKDFAESVTGETYDKHYTNHFYLHKLYDFLNETVTISNATEHFYLCGILELISLRTSTVLSISVPSVITYSDAFTITGVLNDKDDNVLEDASVKLLVDNVVVDNTDTDNSGAVSFSQTISAMGSHTFKLTYEGDDTYKESESETVERTVGKETSVLTVNTPSTSSASYYTDETITVSGVLTDDDSTPNPIQNATVLIKQGDTVLETLTTDNNGEFTTTLDLAVGLHNLTILYEETSNYTESSTTRNITISKHTTTFNNISYSKTTLYTDETLSVTGSLLDESNNGVNGATILLMNGNTQLDTATTDSNGAFSFSEDLTADTYSLHLEYEATSNYNGATSSDTTITVNPVSLTLVTDKSVLSYANSESATLTATYGSGTPTGQTIGLYDASDDSLITTMTDNNDGTYSATYTSENIESKTFYAKTSNITSNNIIIYNLRTITLHTDKSILSYTNSESATLTCTLENGGSQFAGQTVQLYDSNDNLIGVMTDNLDGTYSYTYNSANNGDVSFYAKIGTTTSNNINIKDILYYDKSSSANVSRYTRSSSNVSLTYNATEETYIINNSVRQHYYYTIKNVAIPNNAIIECDLKIPETGNSQIGLGVGNIQWKIIHATEEPVYTLRITKASTTKLAETNYTTDNDWYHMKVELNDGIGTLTLSRDGATLETFSYDVSSQISGNDVRLYVGYDANRYIRFKNISVRTN